MSDSTQEKTVEFLTPEIQIDIYRKGSQLHPMWTLDFMLISGKETFRFECKNPYRYSINDWKLLAQGKKDRLGLAVGKCVGYITTTDKTMSFTRFRGSSCAKSTITIPLKCITEKLTEAIDYAEAKECMFAGQNKKKDQTYSRGKDQITQTRDNTNSQSKELELAYKHIAVLESTIEDLRADLKRKNDALSELRIRLETRLGLIDEEIKINNARYSFEKHDQ